MKIFSVHHKATEPALILSAGLETRFVKEGVAWGALIAPPIWALFHQLWLVLFGVLVLYAIAGGISDLAGLNENTALLVFLTIHVIVALEGNNLRRWTLKRNKFHEISSVTGDSLEKCERRFFESLLEAPIAFVSATPIQPTPTKSPLAGLRPPLSQGESVLGLFPEPEPKS